MPSRLATTPSEHRPQPRVIRWCPPVSTGSRTSRVRREGFVSALAVARHKLVDPAPRDPVAAGEFSGAPSLEDNGVDHMAPQAHLAAPAAQRCSLCPETFVHYAMKSHTATALRLRVALTQLGAGSRGDAHPRRVGGALPNAQGALGSKTRAYVCRTPGEPLAMRNVRRPRMAAWRNARRSAWTRR
jgi:hypothetical protein